MHETLHHGSHAKIEFVGGTNPKFIRKIFGPFETARALELAENLRQYKCSLLEHGIAFPRSVVRLDVCSRHTSTVIEACEYIGMSLHVVIQDENYSDGLIQDLLMQYLHMFAVVRERGYQISLDPPLFNFCVRENRVYYCDNWPPRHNFTELPFVELSGLQQSNHYLMYRYFSDVQLRVIYAQLMRSLVGRTYFTPARVRQLMGKVFGDNLLSTIWVTESEAQYALSCPSPYAADTLRIIASEMVGASYKLKWLERVFGATKIGSGGVVPAEESLRLVSRALKKYTRPTTYRATRGLVQTSHGGSSTLRQSRVRQAQLYLEKMKTSYGALEKADLLIQRGYLLIGTAKSDVWHSPQVPMTYRARGDHPGWYPRISTYRGDTYPLLIAHATADTAVWAAMGGDINVQFQRSKLGLTLSPMTSESYRTSFGWEYSKSAIGYRLRLHQPLWEVIREIESETIIGCIDVVDNDGSFVVSVPDEPQHFASPYTHRTIVTMPVRVSDILALSPNVYQYQD